MMIGDEELPSLGRVPVRHTRLSCWPGKRSWRLRSVLVDDEVELFAVALELALPEPVRHARERGPQVSKNQGRLEPLVSEESSLGHPSPEDDGVVMRILG